MVKSVSKKSVRFLTGIHVRLDEGKKDSTITIIRVGSFFHREYGRFEVTKEILDGLVRNFESRTYGQDIFVDVGHKPQDGAAGEIKKLFVERNRLRAVVEWTPYGIEAIKEKGYRYISADYTENWKDNEFEKEHGPVLFGAALVTRPHIKNMDAVQLSEGGDDGEIPTLFHYELINKLTEEVNTMFKTLLEALMAQLKGLKLTDAMVKNLGDAFKQALDAAGITEEAKGKILMESFVNAGKILAEGSEPGAIQLQFSPGITADDVDARLRKMLEEQETERKKLEEHHSGLVAHYKKQLSEGESFKALGEDLQASMLQLSELITPEMNQAQVDSMVNIQLSQAEKLAAQAKLAGMGYQVPGAAGSVHISVDDSNSIKQLQETVDKRLGISSKSDSKRFSQTDGKLQEENKAIADKVLAQYDAEHGHRLASEAKQLAAGSGVVADTVIPASFERTVIREALYQIVGFQFVNSDVLPFAASHMMPYSYRDTTAAGTGDVHKYQGQGIQRAGIIQKMDTAYPVPLKIAFEVSDELRYLTQAGHINYDSVAENQMNASRIVRESIEGMIFNELVDASDEYQAVAVTNEGLSAQTNGANQIFVMNNFPVVRPRVVRDLEGTQVGTTDNAITITLAGTPIEEYSGQTAAGTYYVMDYNLGEFYFINEAQAVQTPAGADTLSVNYSYATNSAKFDIDLGTDATDVHWDKFLTAYGLRKALIEDSRFHDANFGVMSGNFMTQVEQAKQFGANSKRNGTDLAMDGNLGRIKDVANFKTKAPGLLMGDQRCVIGERGVQRFRNLKPWTMTELENQRDANGRFTGVKEAYGDQFVIVHTPSLLKRSLTSIVLYSSSGRVARAF